MHNESFSTRSVRDRVAGCVVDCGSIPLQRGSNRRESSFLREVMLRCGSEWGPPSLVVPRPRLVHETIGLWLRLGREPTTAALCGAPNLCWASATPGWRERSEGSLLAGRPQATCCSTRSIMRGGRTPFAGSSTEQILAINGARRSNATARERRGERSGFGVTTVDTTESPLVWSRS